MRKSILTALMLSSIALASASCGPKPEVQPVISTLCTDLDRYHTTGAQAAAVKADPATWFSLFQWLASVDIVYDKRCGTRPASAPAPVNGASDEPAAKSAPHEGKPWPQLRLPTFRSRT